MKVIYENDSEKGFGYGRLLISEILPPDPPFFIALQRGSDKYFATARKDGKWVAEKIFIPVEGDFKNPAELEISLNPDIVDMLDPQDIYRIQLKGADGDVQKCTFTTGSIIKSADENLIGKAETSASKSAPQEIKADSDESVKERQEAGAPLNDNKIETGEIQDNEAIIMPEEAPQKNSRVLRYVLLAILCLACLGWYLFDKRNNAKGDEPVVAEAPQSSPSATLEDSVKEFFNNPDRNPDLAMRLASGLSPAKNQEKDAIYRLYYYAADKGNPEALMKYGECLDPSAPDWGSISKDGFLAWQAYSDAAVKNMSGAEEALKKLDEWIRGQAGQGNADARKWLQQIEAVKR